MPVSTDPLSPVSSPHPPFDCVSLQPSVIHLRTRTVRVSLPPTLFSFSSAVTLKFIADPRQVPLYDPAHAWNSSPWFQIFPRFSLFPPPSFALNHFNYLFFGPLLSVRAHASRTSRAPGFFFGVSLDEGTLDLPFSRPFLSDASLLYSGWLIMPFWNSRSF